MKNISFQLQRIQYGWTLRSKVTRGALYDLLSLMSAPVSPNQCHLRMSFTLILLTIAGQLSQVKESLQTDAGSEGQSSEVPPFKDADSGGQSSEDLPFKVNTWILIVIVAGAIVLGLIVIAIVWFVRRKISNARRNRNNRDNLWTTPDSNTCSPYRVSIRSSFRFSRDLETPREQECENAYCASQSTEFLNDTQHSPRGLHTKPYFITFRE
ncbi:uncharacterized protein LOC134338790 isoform X1 [Mobula hypostoma]|uniref:uncharacterized protein LOC134338790 isoform X1 n=1 Tax=Mobula hypostoma TaxID=723540 RepID=UPI002FC3A8AC